MGILEVLGAFFSALAVIAPVLAKAYQDAKKRRAKDEDALTHRSLSELDAGADRLRVVQGESSSLQ